jgi:FkbM family methyltransferase
VGKRQKRHVEGTVLEGAAFLPEFMSYAQNYEDVMLRRALRDVKSGYYIDVGAFHPTIDNVSCSFYQSGWTGINVEPNEKFFLLLTAERPRDVNLQLAITSKSGLTTLYLCDALSTVREEIASAHRQNGIEISQTSQVEAITLDQLFEGYVESRTVDFLKLDVEGSERDILNSTSFERTRPRILVIEATKPDSRQPTRKTWERALLKKGYIPVWFDGLNRFYLREEDSWRRKFFKTPPNVFDSLRFAPHDRRIKFADGQSFETICVALEATRQQIASLDIEREQIVAKATTLERELEFARADASHRTAESDRMASISGHLERALSTALDKLWKFNHKINTLVREKVEAEAELQAIRGENSRLSTEREAVAADIVRAQAELEAARSENSRLSTKREAVAADVVRAQAELEAARGENSRLSGDRERLSLELARHELELRASAGLAAERDNFAAEKIRIESELDAIRSENSRLLAEHQQEKARLERELGAARHDAPRVIAERDRLAVEIARYQIKQCAHAELIAEHERLAADSVRWFEAAVAAPYARPSQAGGSVRGHFKLTVTVSGGRPKCSISRPGWERGPRTSLALAGRAFEERQWQLAARYYGDVLEQWPNNASVWVQFGHALKEASKVAEAEAVYRHAIQLSPAIGDSHLQLGHALKMQGRIRDAAEAYFAALRLDPMLQHAEDELIALGWTSSDIGKAKSHDRVPESISQKTHDGAVRRFGAKPDKEIVDRSSGEP